MVLVQQYDELFREHFDIADDFTRSTYVSLNEDGKGQMLVSLTSKLYDKIVEKVDNIDYGTIPKSKGDITKIENFDSMMECLDIMRNIIKQYGQSEEPVNVIYDAVNNIRERQELFSRAFALNVELPIVLYNSIVLSIVSSISFLIATTIEFVKNPGDDSYQVSLDKVAYVKTSSNLLFDDLRKFNVACIKKEVDTVVDACIKGNVKSSNLVGTISAAALAISVVIALLKNILPLLQELTYFFYHSRQSVSDYFAVQADLITINASNLVYNDNINDAKKKKIIDKQNKIANRFKKIANFFDIEYKKSEKETKKSVESDKKKVKLKDNRVNEEEPSALF